MKQSGHTREKRPWAEIVHAKIPLKEQSSAQLYNTECQNKQRCKLGLANELPIYGKLKRETGV